MKPQKRLTPTAHVSSLIQSTEFLHLWLIELKVSNVECLNEQNTSKKSETNQRNSNVDLCSSDVPSGDATLFMVSNIFDFSQNQAQGFLKK